MKLPDFAILLLPPLLTFPTTLVFAATLPVRNTTPSWEPTDPAVVDCAKGSYCSSAALMWVTCFQATNSKQCICNPNGAATTTVPGSPQYPSLITGCMQCIGDAYDYTDAVTQVDNFIGDLCSGSDTVEQFKQKMSDYGTSVNFPLLLPEATLV